MSRGIFVFGSNEGGFHGGGAARDAATHYGAKWGVGVGRTGDSYALPTKDKELKTLPLPIIAAYVLDFLEYARQHPECVFLVTKVGCGLAGLKEEDIAPMFAGAPDNVGLPYGWD